MAKPLELQRFTLWASELDGTVYAEKPGERFPTSVAYVVLAKRLTDAELAAEVQRASLEVYRARVHRKPETHAVECYLTTLRFATHPHHDEEARDG